MFTDEASFGRISKGAACWAPKYLRPTFASHHLREYNYCYGAVDPIDGRHHFMIYPNCNTDRQSDFLKSLSDAFPEDCIFLVMDNASWHHSKDLEIPDNIHLAFIPPYTPEMNPIEQIWKEIRLRGFMNRVFKSLDTVMDKLCEVIRGLEDEVVASITGRDWCWECFEQSQYDVLGCFRC